MRDKFRESGTTRRPCTFEGKANAHQEEKRQMHWWGTRGKVNGMWGKRTEIGPEIPRLPLRSDGGKRRPSSDLLISWGIFGGDVELG